MEYRDHVPTALDRHIRLDEREDWLVAPVSQSRDSSARERANFDAMLEDLGGESESVEVHRFGHWGPGWYEIILVKPTDIMRRALEEWQRCLENYPIVDESLVSEYEWEERGECWDSYGRDGFRSEIWHLIPESAEEWLDHVPDDTLDEWWEWVLRDGHRFGRSFCLEETHEDGAYFNTEEGARLWVRANAMQVVGAARRLGQ